MLTSKQCLKRYGEPQRETSMVLWDVPTTLEFGMIPKKIYLNEDLIFPLESALRRIIDRGLIKQLRTWDGCFNIRPKKNGRSPSLHSWGLAIDINAAWNGFGKKPTMSNELVECFTESGFDWGGEWKTPDGMHFQLKEIISVG